MPPRFMLKAAEKASTPIEETMVPKLFKKAGVAMAEETFWKTRSFLNFGPGSRDEPIEKNRGWRTSLLENLMPLLDFERGEAAAKKAEAISSGGKSVDRELKGWHILSRMEKWAGGLIATAAFITNPLSCARLAFDVDGKVGDGTTYLLVALGTVIFGFAAWAKMKISEARMNFNYLSESISTLANEILPADAKAKELASETMALLASLREERGKNDAIHYAQAARKTQALFPSNEATDAISEKCIRAGEQAEIASLYLEEARNSLAGLAEKTAGVEKLSVGMSTRGADDLKLAMKNLEAVGKAIDDFQKSTDSAVAIVASLNMAPGQGNGSASELMLSSAMRAVSDLFFLNSRTASRFRGGAVVPAQQYVQKTAIEESEHVMAHFASLIRESKTLVIGESGVDSLSTAILFIAKNYEIPVETGVVSDLIAASFVADMYAMQHRNRIDGRASQN